MNRQAFLLFLATPLLTLATGGRFCHGGSPPAAAKWEQGDLWKIAVRVPAESTLAPQQGGKPKAEIWRALVIGAEQVQGADCWRVAFVPEVGPTTQPHSIWYLSVDKQTGWPRKLLREAGGSAGPMPLLSVQGASLPALVTGVPPLAQFPLGGPLNFRSETDASVVAVETRERGGKVVVELSLKRPGLHDLLIRQTWVRGEKWWRSYEHLVNGKTELSATLLNPPQRSTAEPADDPFYLRRDLQLHGMVSVVGKDISLTAVFEKLHQATGLAFTVAPGLGDHQPVFVDMQMPKVPAWSVMDVVAVRGLKAGKWEKVEDGYCLTGTSALPPPPAITAITAWLVWSMVALGVPVVLLLATWGWRRHRGKDRQVRDEGSLARSPASRGPGPPARGGAREC